MYKYVPNGLKLGKMCMASADRSRHYSPVHSTEWIGYSQGKHPPTSGNTIAVRRTGYYADTQTLNKHTTQLLLGRMENKNINIGTGYGAQCRCTPVPERTWKGIAPCVHADVRF